MIQSFLLNPLPVDNSRFSVDNSIVLWITYARTPLISTYNPLLSDYP